jgi:hypothetical protein
VIDWMKYGAEVVRDCYRQVRTMRAWLWTFLIGFAAGVAATTQYAWPLMFLVLMPFFFSQKR